MIRVAIVDDEDDAAQQLEQCLREYERDCNTEFDIDRFASGDTFLEKYTLGKYQIVFLDISMPGTDGYKTSRILRGMDANVVLIFVTNLAQYAIKGYEVGALDYILKPVAYYSLKMKIKRALAAVHAESNVQISVTNGEGLWRFNANDLCYVEVIDHVLVYHTKEVNIRAVGSLKNEEKRLSEESFFRCNYCYLVNLRCVTGVQGNMAIVNGDKLQISRSRKKEFLQRLTAIM